jgi:hypothetical protein
MPGWKTVTAGTNKTPPPLPADKDLAWLGALGLPFLFVFGMAWLRWGLPVPKCVLHGLTGLPCLSCGGTRAATSWAHGDPVSAFFYNPGVALFLPLLGLLWAYSLGVVINLFPPRRVAFFAAWRWPLCFLLVLLLAANWIYLLYRFSRPG